MIRNSRYARRVPRNLPLGEIQFFGRLNKQNNNNMSDLKSL